MKLLIADDEPLVLIGMQSMLRWEDYGIEQCLTARNGRQALELIEQHRPDIVITDIKMPLMSGLELAQASRERFGSLPVFIMLTSYEEFNFVKEAMHYGALEYLIKLELTPQSLAASVERAAARVREVRGAESRVVPGEGAMQNYRDKFFVRLYNDLFENNEQYLRQKADLGLDDFAADSYAAVVCTITGIRDMPAEKQVALCAGCMQMAQDIVGKFVPCCATGLDTRHFNLALCLTRAQAGDTAFLTGILGKAVETVYKFFSVRLLCAVGDPVPNLRALSGSARRARQLSVLASEIQPVVADGDDESVADVFDLARYKSELTRAFEEMDTELLDRTISAIAAQLRDGPAGLVQAMDAACSLLFMAISLIPDGEATVEAVFGDEPDGYRVLYRQTTTENCCLWIEHLRDGLCDMLNTQRKNYKNRVVRNVELYIKQNVGKRLTLNGVAAAFNFSPSYLSQLFAKYARRGFVETITKEKVEAAKGMLSEGKMKIYEIAERLGYESAFYFSKVFKKETGLSPREYMQKQMR